MDLSVTLKNCYGIGSLDHKFQFNEDPKKTSQKSFAIYAPNGTMKSSFARTFEAISKGQKPKEERFGRPSTATILKDGNPIKQEEICVLHAKANFNASEAVSTILVSPKKRDEYNKLVVDVDKAKKGIVDQIFKRIGTKKTDTEQEILRVVGGIDFYSCIQQLKELQLEEDYSELPYEVIFNDKVLQVVGEKDFAERAQEYTERYDSLFEETENLLTRGIFNPTKANTSMSTLEKQNFFKAGHRVHIKGEESSIGKDEFEHRLAQINEKIGSDETLKKIRDALAKNADVQAFNVLLETLSTDKIQQLLEGVKPGHITQFRKNMLASIIQDMPEVDVYYSKYTSNHEQIKQIESEAEALTSQWYEAVRLFQTRFIDMPFTPSVQNSSFTVLGKEKAILEFIFRDEETKKTKTVEPGEAGGITTLSDGEARALDLLYFIFEVEARKNEKIETVFVIDDIADSFDYKNKHAIIQYLGDLNAIPYFYQIILTHNFDFFRALENNNIVSYLHCLMANKESSGTSLTNTNCIKNYFVTVIQKKINQSGVCLLASIPFTRNIIEYTKGFDDSDYSKLTEMLHWKEGSDSILLGEYCTTYNKIFSEQITKPELLNSNQPIFEFMKQEAKAIVSQANTQGLCLENKILLSMVIRIMAEKKIIEIRRNLDPAFQWPNSKECFGEMLRDLKKINQNLPQLAILNSVGVIVNNNIHLNSFMYEPIIDLTIIHLNQLYSDVDTMSTEVPLLESTPDNLV